VYSTDAKCEKMPSTKMLASSHCHASSKKEWFGSGLGMIHHPLTAASCRITIQAEINENIVIIH
jgi:hypothetical protein